MAVAEPLLYSNAARWRGPSMPEAINEASGIRRDIRFMKSGGRKPGVGDIGRNRGGWPMEHRHRHSSLRPRKKCR